MNRRGRSFVPLITMATVYVIILITVLIRANTIVNQNDNNYTIAQVIASEGCGEGKIGMYLIANTIKNRSEQWNKTPYEVVTQPNQYYGLTNPNKIQLYNQCKEFSDELALKVLDLTDLTDDAIYFLKPEEKRRRWHTADTLRYKNHIFYK